MRSLHSRRGSVLLLLVATPMPTPHNTSPHQAGAISGVVRQMESGRPIGGAIVNVKEIGLQTRTSSDGRYRLSPVPVGEHTVEFLAVGRVSREVVVHVAPDTTVTLHITLTFEPVVLGSIIVNAVSMAPERIIDAPAAVDIIDLTALRDMAISGQAPLAMATVPGWDVVQNGVHDFNVNARGFNSTLARSITVLQDGRDISVPFLGSQEWAAMSIPTDEFRRMEAVRGPSSALYGANAYNGVIAITTLAARDLVGTKLSLAGGELGTLRGSFRHARVTHNGRLGFKVNIDYSRSKSWSRSRTRFDGADFIEEYVPATELEVEPPEPGFELSPLHGQVKDPTTGEAQGKPDDLRTVSGTARFDYYAKNGSVLTVDGGGAQVENGLFVTAIGRVQVIKATRPWARVAWASDDFDVTAWYSGRTANEPQVLLASAIPIDDNSGILHVEGRYHANFLDDRGRLVVGTSLRETRVNTKGTLMALATDDRTDQYYSGFGQIEYSLVSWMRVVWAARWDNSNLFRSQFSPKGAVVFTPTQNHAFRLTASRAFLTPSQTEFFLRIQPNTQDLSMLEAGLRASPLGPALVSVPNGTLFDASAAVPVIAHGNAQLIPEKVTSYELGYKGQIDERLFLTVDGYFNRRTNFVTSLLPATIVNSTFQPWTAPASVPQPAREPLENAVRQNLTGTLAEFGLTRLEDGTTAIVLSYGNAGKVNEWGMEVGVHVEVTDDISLKGTYSIYDFDITEALEGHDLSPNTPKHKGAASLSYMGQQGLDFGMSGRLVSSHRWVSGIFQGTVPSSQTVNLHAGYFLTPNTRVHATATNVLNQQRFHVYGGSVNGRRVLGGLTAIF